MESRSHAELKRTINGRIHILILGSYKRRHKRRLTSIRDALREAGFSQTNLVEDFPDEHKYNSDLDIHFTKKSEHYIVEWADEVIFVLFSDSDNQGVLSEFRFCSVMGKDVLQDSIILTEEGVRLSSQVLGPIKLTRVNTATFRDDESLQGLSLGHTVKTVHIHLSELMRRME